MTMQISDKKNQPFFEDLSLHIPFQEMTDLTLNSKEVFVSSENWKSSFKEVFTSRHRIEQVESNEFNQVLKFTSYFELENLSCIKSGASISFWYKTEEIKPDENLSFSFVLNGTEYDIKVKSHVWNYIYLDNTNLFLNGKAARSQSCKFSTEHDNALILASKPYTGGYYFSLRVHNRQLNKNEICKLMLHDKKQATKQKLSRQLEEVLNVGNQIKHVNGDKIELSKGYRKAYPLNVDLHTVWNDEEHKCFYKENANKTEPLILRLSRITSGKSKIPISLKSTEGNPFQVQLRFRKDILSPIALDEKKDRAGDNWEVIIDTAHHEVDIISLKYTEGVFPINEHTPDIILDHTSAAKDAPEGNTRVEVRYQLEDGSMGNEIIHMEVQSHLGVKNIPMKAEVLGMNMLLNDGLCNNELTIRLSYTHMDQKGIQLVKEDQLAKIKGSEFHLVLSDELAPILNNLPEVSISTKELNASTSNQLFDKEPPGNGDSRKQWKITPAEVITLVSPHRSTDSTEERLVTNIDINISNYQLTGSNGSHNIRLHYQGIEGYWDNSIEIPVILGPIRITKKKIHLDGKYQTLNDVNLHGQLLIGNAEKLKTPETSLGAENGILFGPETLGKDHAYIRFHSRSGAAHNLEIQVDQNGEDHLVLQPKGGMVGLGLDEPAAKLHVQGDKDQDQVAQFEGGKNSIARIDLYPKGKFEQRVELVHDGSNFRFYKKHDKTGDDPNNRFSGHLLVFSNKGYAGFGNCAEPKAQLHVKGDNSTATATAYFEGGNVGIGVEKPTAKLHIVGEPNSTLAYFEGGNVGVGVEKPTAKLHVKGENGKTVAHFEGGNVGIGTSDPHRTVKLHVRADNTKDTVAHFESGHENYSHLNIYPKGNFDKRVIITNEIEHENQNVTGSLKLGIMKDGQRYDGIEMNHYCIKMGHERVALEVNNDCVKQYIPIYNGNNNNDLKYFLEQKCLENDQMFFFIKSSEWEWVWMAHKWNNTIYSFRLSRAETYRTDQ